MRCTVRNPHASSSQRPSGSCAAGTGFIVASTPRISGSAGFAVAWFERMALSSVAVNGATSTPRPSS